MRDLIRRTLRGASALAVTGALMACDNEIPTATGSDLFPGGLTPTTLLAEFGGSDFLLSEEVFRGFGDPRLSPFLLVGNDFDGEFDAHTLVRFTAIPDTVSYTDDGAPQRAEIENYAGGRVLVHVDSLATTPRGTIRLLLWELDQAWDSSSVSWERAVDNEEQQVPWTTPGGTTARLIGSEFWIPGDTAQADTVALPLDSLAVARMRTEGHPGLMITSDQPGVRVKVTGLVFAGDARPAGNPDTLVEVRSEERVDAFIFTPETPENPDVLASGGLRGDRSLVTIRLDQEVEACPEDGGECTVMPLRDITLNRAQLVLQPVPVPGGHRPVATPTVQLRRVAEPHLGRLAPLGPLVASDTISPAALEEGGEEFTLDLTTALLQFLALQRSAIANGEEPETQMSLALLTSFQVPDLGLLWFERSPRLRVIYTLPLNPALP
ncbi:MAG TPA: hypothetical protein VF167_18755 [Longimicrobiaceae bacterium]